MIKIGKPYIEQKENTVYLKSQITDSLLGKEFTLWFSVDKVYEQYICYETVDSFLLVVLQLAMSTHQTIQCEAPVSSKLLFHLRNNLMAMLTKVIPQSQVIEVDAEATDLCFDARGVGCGCSLGVDSFSALFTHLKGDIPSSYKATHLTLFNTGHFGNQNTVEAEKAFYGTVEALKPFSAEIGLPIVAINSNLNDVCANYQVTFLQSIIQTTIGAALVLQKLFGHYVYASSYLFEEVHYTAKDVSYAESAIVPLLSTNSMEVISSNSDMTRVQKTAFIANNSLVQKYLDVCWATCISNSFTGSTLLIGKTKKNCGKCDKCLRTLFTIELILGSVDAYAGIFDLDEYRKYRGKFLIKVLSMRHENAFYQEIYELMQKKQVSVPMKYVLASWLVKLGVYKLLQKVFRITTMAH